MSEATGSNPERAEMIALTDAVLDLFVGRSHADARLARDLRYTENSQLLDVGDGFWATCSGRGRYRQYAIDLHAMQAGFIGVMLENDRQVLFGMRLKLRGQEIAEIEAMVSRDPILFYKDGPQKLEARQQPLALWTERVAESERSSRADMIAIAEAYFNALERNDGTRSAPIAADCDRMDNGVMATHAPEFDKPGEPPFYALGPAEQLATGYFRFVTRIRDRRYPVVDQDFGIVFSTSFLDHSGTVGEVKLTDGRTVPIGVDSPFSWQVMELFKISGGKIRQIEVLLNKCFYGMRPNWPAD